MESPNYPLQPLASNRVQGPRCIHVWSLFPEEAHDAKAVVQQAGYEPEVIRLNANQLSFKRQSPQLMFAWLPVRNERASLAALHLLHALVRPEIPILLATDPELIKSTAFFANGRSREIITRPISVDEFNTRAALLIARSSNSDPFVFGEYEFRGGSLIRIPGGSVHLQMTLYDIALYFFRNSGRVISRLELKEQFWPMVNKAGRAIDIAVSRIRSQLQLDECQGYRLRAIRGQGYLLEECETDRR